MAYQLEQYCLRTENEENTNSCNITCSFVYNNVCYNASKMAIDTL
jgi:hypothetical protein